MAEITTTPGNTVTVQHPEHGVEFSLAAADPFVRLNIKREDGSEQSVQLGVEENGKVTVRVQEDWNLVALVIPAG